MHDDRGESEIPWQPPVIAAIIGALVVATFVIYAIVSGPVEDPEADALAESVPSLDLPTGYTPLLSDLPVGIRVESVSRDGGFTTVVVSSAVAGSTDPSEAPLPDVAYWEFGPEGDRARSEAQFTSNDAAGITTIVVPVEKTPSEAIVVAHPVVGTREVGTEIEVGPERIGEQIDFVVDFDDVAISGFVTVGDGWGYVEWSSTDGVVGTLDVDVTFVGTENRAADVLEPIRLVPAYDPSLARPGTVITPTPLWAFGGSYGLYGDGRSLTEGGEASSIVITLEGTVVTGTGPPVVLDPPSDG